MANTLLQTVPPVEVWRLIKAFAGEEADDVELFSFGEIDLLGWNERARRIGAAVERATQGEMETAEVPVGSYREDALVSRAQIRDYAGKLPFGVLRNATLHEFVVQGWFDHSQSFPMQLEVETEEGLVEFEHDQTYDPAAVSLALMRPYDDFQRRVLGGENPWNTSYLVRRIGPTREVGLTPRMLSAVKLRRALLLAIKAELFKQIVMGRIRGAFAQSDWATGEPQSNKYVELAQLVLGGLLTLCEHTFGIVAEGWAWLSDLLPTWYWALPRTTQATLELFAALALLTWLFLLARQEPVRLEVVEPKKPDQYLGQMLTEKGMRYRVLVNGKELLLPADEQSSGTHQDEMAMPGSEYFPCRHQPIGAILVTTKETDLRLFSVFWRLEDYLITARHSAHALNASTARVYLASLVPTKKGNFEIKTVAPYNAPEEFFSPEHNAVGPFYDHIDVYAKELDPKVWSLIGVAKAPLGTRSSYGQQVHSVGFTVGGLLVSASGRTLEGSGHELLHHTASTQKGFSGSILLCGNSVVGMHVRAADGHNVAVRVEMIQYLLSEGTELESASKNKKRYTYADAAYKAEYRQHKWRGAVTTVKLMRDGKFSIVLENGEATYGWGMEDLVDCFGVTGDVRKDEDLMQDLVYANTPRARGHHVEFEDDRYHRSYNENADIRSVESSGSRSRGSRGRRRESTLPRGPPPETLPMIELNPQDKEDAKIFVKKTGLKPVHGPSAPKLQPEAQQLIQDFEEEVKALGYEEGVFDYPDMSPKAEEWSLIKHIRLFGERVRSVTKPPSESEMKRAAMLVASMMQEASFTPDPNYKSLSGVLDVINSSIIDPKKSSGFPYCVQGQPTNKQVLQSYGEKGFAQHVLNEWDTLSFEAKNFLKGEPTKKSKLAKGMPRCIEGFPLHVTVKHASVFKRLSAQLVLRWKHTPVKYAFSPANPGALEHLGSCLPGKVWSSDKEVWDYGMLLWIAHCTRDVVKMLANAPQEWSEEELNGYLSDIDGCFEQVFERATYRTTNGTTIKVLEGGIMKSGWFFTIGANSIAQVVVDVMTKMRSGLSDDEILGLAIIAGGDDVEQEPVPCGIETYTTLAQELGVGVKITERESLFHSEFFSNDLRMSPEGPQFFPQRWTKHIEHIRVIKREDLGQALVSHMGNYRHHPEKFNLLRKMYLSMHEKFPGEFPKSGLVSRYLLLAQQYGYESEDC